MRYPVGYKVTDKFVDLIDILGLRVSPKYMDLITYTRRLQRNMKNKAKRLRKKRNE